ncbi:MAG TPA: BON domain-containing protein [Gammaproteobacteria bacterium]|nr:BON domain-containing protein [Gammaproteobacteria bacterium]
MTIRWLTTGTLLLVALLSSGCVPVILAGGVAATTTVIHDRRTAGEIIEDEAIEGRVKAALGKDPELNEQSHINITSYDGVVLLSGETPTEAMRTRAGEIARIQREVRRVHNELVVAAPSSLMTRTSDSLITSRVKSALFGVKIEGFDPTRVKIVTENGTVYLMGMLYRAEAAAVTEQTRQISGVQRIVTLYQFLD